jgi:hypothetical protein
MPHSGGAAGAARRQTNRADRGAAAPAPDARALCEGRCDAAARRAGGSWTAPGPPAWWGRWPRAAPPSRCAQRRPPARRSRRLAQRARYDRRWRVVHLYAQPLLQQQARLLHRRLPWGRLQPCSCPHHRQAPLLLHCPSPLWANAAPLPRPPPPRLPPPTLLPCPAPPRAASPRRHRAPAARAARGPLWRGGRSQAGAARPRQR